MSPGSPSSSALAIAGALTASAPEAPNLGVLGVDELIQFATGLAPEEARIRCIAALSRSEALRVSVLQIRDRSRALASQPLETGAVDELDARIARALAERLDSCVAGAVKLR